MTDETWRDQMFFIRAEDKTGSSEFVEMKMPLEHVLSIIEILLKQKRNQMIGRNFLNLLLTSNPKAINLLEKLGFVDFHRIDKNGEEK
jgi:hypothetical protein